MPVVKKSVRAGFALALMVGAAPASAQSPSSSFTPGSGLATTQSPGYAQLIAGCKTPLPPPPPPRPAAAPLAAPPPPPFPAVMPAPSPAIPGVLAANQSWKSVWQWSGNNLDGVIATPAGTILGASNEAGQVMEIYPATGLGRIAYGGLNAPGAVGRSKNGALFVAERGLPARIVQLEPVRKVLADKINGEPLECAGGILNDITVDARGGVYASGSGVLYANPAGVVTKYGEGIRSNGIILSADEKVLYVTDVNVVVAFDVHPDGSLTNRREFAKLHTGRGGDGSAIDAQGRLYVATGGFVEVFSPTGDLLGTITGPTGLHGVVFGGTDKRTLYGIILYGGASNRHNELVALPMEAQGYMGRAK
jgi:sugar lactone lactonase YvrE